MAQMSIERGVNFVIKGDIPKALEKYKYAEDILKHTGPLDSFFIYASYFELYADLKDYKKAKYYFDILEKHEIYQQRAYYKIHMEFYNGVLLKLSKSTRNKALAMNIFEKIAIGPLIDHTVTFQALIHFLDMLITKLIESEDNHIYEEVKHQIDKIEKFASGEKISDLQAKALLFKSKIALIEGNFDEAKRILLVANNIADEYGYTSLSIRISSEYDELYRLVNRQIISGNNGNNNFRDRLVNSRLNHLITQYSLSKPKIVEIEESIPMHLFVTRFDNEEVIEMSIAKSSDEDYKSLISTIRTLISSFKKPEDTIDRLNFNDYIITSFSDDNWIMCMIFKGSSYQIGSYMKQIMTILIENRENELTATNIQNASLSVIQNHNEWSN